MNKAKFGEKIAWLASAFPRAELNPATVQVYYDMLNDLPDEILQAAIVKVAAENRFFPTISEIRKAAQSFIPEIARLPDKYTAWEQVMRTIKSDWRGHDPLHPVIERAVKVLGGWYGIATSETQAAERARFLEAYETFASRYREMRSQPPLLMNETRKLLGGPND